MRHFQGSVDKNDYLCNSAALGLFPIIFILKYGEFRVLQIPVREDGRKDLI